MAATLLLRGSREAAGPAPASLPAGRLAVAVLPIQDQSGDPELSRAGISEILRNAFVQLLSEVPNLYVVSPLRFDGAAAELKRAPADAASDIAFAKKVCKKAGAGAMLSGRLARVGVDCNVKLKEKGRAVVALERYLKQPFLGNHGRQQARWRLEELRKKPAAQAEARVRLSLSPPA